MTPARQPHPQRCETCEHFDDDSRKRYCSCKKFDRWMDGEDIAFVEAIGCASHSRATHTSPRVSVLVDPAGDCDTCRFVKECSPLYLPPCYNGGEIRAAKDAREQDIEALESLCSTRKSRYEDPDEPEERREFLRGVSEGVQMARRVVKSLCAQHREQEQHND